MQRPEEELISMLRKSGVDFAASLPCEKIKALLQMVEKNFQHIPLTREEEGVGICAGAALARRRPAMFVQSSGIGNMINALLSLTAFYKLPLALFISRRGIYKEKIEAQVPMGSNLPAILSGAGIGSTEIDSGDDIKKIEQELPGVYSKNRIHAFLMSPKVWEGSDCGVSGAEFGVKAEKARPHPDSFTLHTASSPALTRYEIIEIIAPYLEDMVVVSNLGWPSKELYAVKHRPSNFYMLGSMGMATPIGLGIAITCSKEVVVIDGDGSLLMNPGTLGTAASLSPNNLTILCIDNAAYGSTGNQPTLAGSCVDLALVARGFGFRKTVKAAKEDEVRNAIKNRKGLTFIHALAIPGNKDLPNVPLDQIEIRQQVQNFLNAEG